MNRKIKRQSLVFGRGLHDLHYRDSTELKIANVKLLPAISPNSTLLHSTESSSRLHSVHTDSKTSSPRCFDTESVASSAATQRKGPNFRKINAAKVRIASLRNKINRTKNIDEITNMMAEVLTLEDDILREKTKGYKLLESKKKMIEARIEKMVHELNKLEDELSSVDMELKQKTEKAKADLAEKIKILEKEYNEVTARLETMPI